MPKKFIDLMTGGLMPNISGNNMHVSPCRTEANYLEGIEERNW